MISIVTSIRTAITEALWPPVPENSSIWQRRGAGIDPALYVVITADSDGVVYRMLARPTLPGGTVIPMLAQDCTVRQFNKLFTPAVVVP